MSIRALAVLVAAVLVAQPITAEAADEAARVLVWPVAADKLPPKLRRQTPAEIASLVNSSDQWQVVEPDARQRKQLNRLARKCRPLGSVACALKVAAATRVPFVLAARFSGARPHLELSLTLVDAGKAGETGAASGRLAPATWKEALRG